MKSSSPKSDSIPHRGGEVNSALGWDYLSCPKRLANIETCTPPLGPASPKVYRARRFFFLWGRVAAHGGEWCLFRYVGCHCATPRRHRTLKKKEPPYPINLLLPTSITASVTRSPSLRFGTVASMSHTGRGDQISGLQATIRDGKHGTPILSWRASTAGASPVKRS